MLAALLALQPVAAGNASDPEITDPSQDVASSSAVADAAQLDLTRAWVQQRASSLLLTAQVADDIAPLPAEEFRFTFVYSLDDTRQEVIVAVDRDGISTDGAALAATIDGSRVMVEVPLDPDMTKLSDFSVESRGTHLDGDSTDRAPDHGSGRNFLVQRATADDWHGASSDPAGTSTVGLSPGGNGEWIWRKAGTNIVALGRSGILSAGQNPWSPDAASNLGLYKSSTGESIWQIEDAFSRGGDALIDNGEIYVRYHTPGADAMESWSIHVRSTEDGRLIRSWQTPTRPYGWTFAHGDLYLAMDGANDDPWTVGRYSSDSGEKIWSIPIDAAIDGDLLVLDDRVVYLSSKSLNVLDAHTGALLMRASLDCCVRHRAVTDGQYVFVHAHDRLSAIHLDTGATAWSIEPNLDPGTFPRMPAYRDGSVYVHTGTRVADGGHDRIHAFDATSGALQWEWHSQRPATGITKMVVTDASVIVGTGMDPYQVNAPEKPRPALFVVNRTDGSTDRVVETVASTTPYGAVNGRLFVGANPRAEPWEEQPDRPHEGIGPHLVVYDLGAGGARRPDVSFEVPRSITARQPALFHDTTAATDRPLNRWIWAVDDYETTRAQDATLTFAAAGERKVRLAVFDDWGRSAAYEVNVTILSAVDSKPSPGLSVGLSLFVAAAIVSRRIQCR